MLCNVTTSINTRKIEVASHLLLIIIIVGAGQKVAKDELWHIHILLLVHLHRNTISVVPDADNVIDLQ